MKSTETPTASRAHFGSLPLIPVGGELPDISSSTSIAAEPKMTEKAKAPVHPKEPFGKPSLKHQLSPYWPCNTTSVKRTGTGSYAAPTEVSRDKDDNGADAENRKLKNLIPERRNKGQSLGDASDAVDTTEGVVDTVIDKKAGMGSNGVPDNSKFKTSSTNSQLHGLKRDSDGLDNLGSAENKPNDLLYDIVESELEIPEGGLGGETNTPPNAGPHPLRVRDDHHDGDNKDHPHNHHHSGQPHHYHHSGAGGPTVEVLETVEDILSGPVGSNGPDGPNNGLAGDGSSKASPLASRSTKKKTSHQKHESNENLESMKAATKLAENIADQEIDAGGIPGAKDPKAPSTTPPSSGLTQGLDSDDDGQGNELPTGDLSQLSPTGSSSGGLKRDDASGLGNTGDALGSTGSIVDVPVSVVDGLGSNGNDTNTTSTDTATTSSSPTSGLPDTGSEGSPTSGLSSAGAPGLGGSAATSGSGLSSFIETPIEAPADALDGLGSNGNSAESNATSTTSQSKDAKRDDSKAGGLGGIGSLLNALGVLGSHDKDHDHKAKSKDSHSSKPHVPKPDPVKTSKGTPDSTLPVARDLKPTLHLTQNHLTATGFLPKNEDLGNDNPLNKLNELKAAKASKNLKKLNPAKNLKEAKSAAKGLNARHAEENGAAANLKPFGSAFLVILGVAFLLVV